MKMKCNKPCVEAAHCAHSKEHKMGVLCKCGCDNGAECVPVALSDGKVERSSNSTKAITDERGANYGHPLDHFPLTRTMANTWLSARKDAIGKAGLKITFEQEMAVDHAVYMICDKLARAATNPKHTDNWDDISGYSRCAKMALGLEK